MISGGISAGALASTSYGVAIGAAIPVLAVGLGVALAGGIVCAIYISKKQVLQKVTLISKSKRCFSKRRKK